MRVLIDQYVRGMSRTAWLDEHSTYFAVTNGIRQGGVISPVLFTIYMDELLKRLEMSGRGCYIGHKYLGVLCYADDVTLLAPTAQSLQHMVKTCEQFGQEFDIKYNATKSMCNCALSTAKSLHP